jgi:hypothetical protein
MLKAGERSQNQKQQRQMTLTTMQTGQSSAQLINSTTTLVANASETSERVRRMSKTLRLGVGEEVERKKGKENSHKQRRMCCFLRCNT